MSTDLVFDGERAPYDEGAQTAPTSVYGRSKRTAEQEVTLRTPNHAIVRTSLLFGPALGERQGFFDRQLDAVRARGPRMALFEDEWRTPLSLRAAAEALVAVALEADLRGTLHVGGPERLSRYEMGARLARSLGAEPDTVFTRASRLDVGGEPRPRDVSLEASMFRRAFPRVATDDFDRECARMGIR